MSRARRRLVEAGVRIEQEPATPADFAALHSILCQVALPRSRVADHTWTVQCGDAWLSVSAGLLDEGQGPVAQIVPYGALPRLAMSWITTEALRHNRREVAVGDSAREFLRRLGLDSQGSRHGRLREQMHALAACRLQMGYHGRTYNGQPVEQFDTWADGSRDRERWVWPGVVVLSESYFNDLSASAVPLDRRALLELKGSALALDIYAWLAHRLHRISGGSTMLRWHHLRDQFGQGYAEGKNGSKTFRRKFKTALGKALIAYPQARVQVVTGGIRLTGSRPPIAPKGGPTL